MPPPVDINLFFGTEPPCVIPISVRAKKLMMLGEGVDAIITLEEPQIALAAIPEDYMMQTTTVPPKLIAMIEKLTVLH